MEKINNEITVLRLRLLEKLRETKYESYINLSSLDNDDTIQNLIGYKSGNFELKELNTYIAMSLVNENGRSDSKILEGIIQVVREVLGVVDDNTFGEEVVGDDGRILTGGINGDQDLIYTF